MKLKEYEMHIRNTHKDQKSHSWCGEKIGSDPVFINIDYAVYALQSETKLVPCPECVITVMKVLNGSSGIREGKKDDS